MILEFHKDLFYEYVMMYRPYVNKLNEQLAPFQLYVSQWSILRFLLREGGQTVSDISTYKKVEKPTTTKMVQKLLDLGYVEVTGGKDKRTKIIQVSEYGHEVCSQVQEKLNQFQKYLLEDVPEGEQELVARVLRRISEKLGTSQ